MISAMNLLTLRTTIPLTNLTGFESINGQNVVSSFNYQEKAVEQFDSLNEELRNASEKAEKLFRDDHAFDADGQQYQVCAFRPGRLPACPERSDDRRKYPVSASVYQDFPAALFHLCADVEPDFLRHGSRRLYSSQFA
jgi:hypothetical protein